MSSTSPQCIFTEGQLDLPPGYEDRTLNVFKPLDPAGAVITIARDALNEGEMLGAYIDRQLQQLNQVLKGWKLESRQPATLGQNALLGESIHASYLREGKRITQHQAVFAVDDRLVLVITQSKSAVLDNGDMATFSSLLESYVAR
jgi:hypothetical protein